MITTCWYVVLALLFLWCDLTFTALACELYIMLTTRTCCLDRESLLLANPWVPFVKFPIPHPLLCLFPTVQARLVTCQGFCFPVLLRVPSPLACFASAAPPRDLPYPQGCPHIPVSSSTLVPPDSTLLSVSGVGVSMCVLGPSSSAPLTVSVCSCFCPHLQ